MKQKKILFCTESGTVNSGYGKYTKNILKLLHDTGKYELAELSCGRTMQDPKTEPWKIYPNSVSKADLRYESYISNQGNKFGQWRVDVCMMDFKPDIVIDFRDIFMMTPLFVSPLRQNYHLMVAPTLDSFPLKTEWIMDLNMADTVLTHTYWAKDILEKQYAIEVGGVVSDAVDPQVFDIKNTISNRMKYNIDTTAFVVGSVMRNQRRKIIPELLQVFRGLLDIDDNYLFLLHTSYPETMGWDIPSLLLEYNLQNHVLLTYKCLACQNIAIKKWSGAICVCNKCNKNKLRLVNIDSGLSDEVLSDIYNTMDAYLQYSICEGFGIPPLEASACGVPVFTPNQGATKEVGENIGATLIDCNMKFRSIGHNADRFYPDNLDCINKIHNLVTNTTIDKSKLSIDNRNMAISNYSWQKTAENFEKIIDNIDTSKTQWKKIPPSYFKKIKTEVPGNLNNRDFVYYIIDNIIEEPSLKGSFFVQNLIESMNNGFIQSKDILQPWDKERAKQVLQIIYNNKITIHKGAYANQSDTQFDFLKYT